MCGKSKNSLAQALAQRNNIITNIYISYIIVEMITTEVDSQDAYYLSRYYNIIFMKL